MKAIYAFFIGGIMEWIKAGNRIIKIACINEFKLIGASSGEVFPKEDKWIIYAFMSDKSVHKINEFDEEKDAVMCFNFLWEDLTKKRKE
jgi:hypothetical protein